MNDKVRAKIAADVAEAKQRAREQLAKFTPEQLAAAKALRDGFPEIMRHAFMSEGNAKGRVGFYIATEAELLRWQGAV